MKLSKSEIKKILYKTILIRKVEEAIASNYGTQGGDQQMRCPVHLSIGQEAPAVGSCINLKKSDQIFSTHRCHAHYLAKGGSLNKMLLEIYGKLGGCLDGRGGSMHLMDENEGIALSIPIVSSSIPLAVGNALTFKLNKLKNVVVSFFGDASVEEGIFHESLNFASLKQLPIVFVCENNLYSCFTHFNDRQPKRPIENLGIAHKIKSYRIQSQNPFEISQKFKQIINNARIKNQPSFVVIDTFRWLQHCGPTSDDHLGYRKKSELKKWMEIDSVALAVDYALKTKKISEKDIDLIFKKIELEISKSFDLAKSASLPSPKLGSKYVYAY